MQESELIKIRSGHRMYNAGMLYCMFSHVCRQHKTDKHGEKSVQENHGISNRIQKDPSSLIVNLRIE